MAFTAAAISAFSDLEEELEQRDPRATGQVSAALERLKGYVEDAQDGRAVAPDGTEELADATRAVTCYAGRYEVKDGEVHHHVEMALNPNMIGMTAKKIMIVACMVKNAL